MSGQIRNRTEIAETDMTFDGHHWPYVSASQFKTFSLCQRKWHIERFSGLPRPPSTPAQALGTEVHEILENYLKYGSEFPDTKAGRIAEAGRGLLPPRGAVVEGKITLTDIEPRLIGFVDVYVPGDIPEIIDHKTLRDWKWAKTSEDLETDLQVIPYAAHALQKTGAEQVRVTHLQYITSGAPAARRASTLLTADQVREQWGGLKALATDMRAVANVQRADAVEGNLNACGAYGGCPYQHICAAVDGPPRHFSGLGLARKEDEMGNGESRLQELLRKRRDAPEGVVPPDVPAPEVAEVAEEKVEAIEPTEGTETPSARQERLLAKHSGADYDRAFAAILSAMKASGSERLSRVESSRIVGEALGMKRARWMYVEAMCDRSGVLDCEEESGYCWWVGEGELADADVPAVVEPVVAPETEPEAEPADPLYLYVDCWPMKGVKCVLLEDILAPYIHAVSDRHGVPTPALLDFGKGKAEVAGWLCLNLPTGHVVVSSKSAYWGAVEPYLVGAAVQVVRRFM